MSDTRPYTDEELATAERATMDFFGPDTLATERDMAMFDAGFKCGRRTPGPATAKMVEWLKNEIILTPTDFDRLAVEFIAEHDHP